MQVHVKWAGSNFFWNPLARIFSKDTRRKRNGTRRAITHDWSKFSQGPMRYAKWRKVVWLLNETEMAWNTVYIVFSKQKAAESYDAKISGIMWVVVVVSCKYRRFATWISGSKMLSQYLRYVWYDLHSKCLPGLRAYVLGLERKQDCEIIQTITPIWNPVAHYNHDEVNLWNFVT